MCLTLKECRMLTTVLDSVWTSLNWTTIVLVVVSFLAYALYRNVSRPAGSPPGPTPLPIIGNILLLTKGPTYEVFNNLAKKYGDIFSIKLGSKLCVVINNIDVAKDAFLKKPEEFAGRPKSFTIEMITMGYKDIAFSPYSETWKLHRKIGHAAIRHFASGKELEKLVHKVLPKLAQALDANEGKSFVPKEVIAVAVYNIIATLCFGHEFSFDDPQLKMWIDCNKHIASEMGNGLPADFLPILRHFPDKRTKRVLKMINQLTDAIADEMKAHKETYNPENIRDLIDSLMKNQQDARDEGSEKIDSLTDVHLLQTVADMFGAGTDNPTTSLDWSIALMVKHPEIQEKVAEEVDRVIGRDRLPCLADRGKLPYTEAAMYEMMRYSSVTPLGVTRVTMEDTTLGGYRIPKDTWVMVNQWGIHYDEKNWDEPHKFKPEHFLDEAGEVRQHPNGFLPFSFGRRVCLGESFAKAEMFLLFAWLFQHYTFSKPPEQKGEFEIKLHPGAGFTHQPDDYNIVVKRRF